MIWNFCAWVGIATLTVLSLWLAYNTVESFIVARIGWTKLGELGFWRSIPVAIITRRHRT